jgi:hypothetical protein
MFSDADLKIIESIVKDFRIDGKSTVHVNGIAHSFFISHAQDPRKESNLATEAWANAIVQYLMISGYEIKKRN